MSSLIEKLQYTKQTKLAIKEAIITKGASCETDCFRQYPERILAIPSGGSGGGSVTPGEGETLALYNYDYYTMLYEGILLPSKEYIYGTYEIL